jgi:hypothetical protein
MGDVSDLNLEVYELPFYYTGMTTVPRRFIGSSLVMGALLFYMKPETFFVPETKESREWKLISNDPNATAMPWWLLSLLFGGLCAVMI